MRGRSKMLTETKKTPRACDSKIAQRTQEPDNIKSRERTQEPDNIKSRERTQEPDNIKLRETNPRSLMARPTLARMDAGSNRIRA